MRQDYLIEIFKELGKILAAVMDAKKTNPARALEQINTAFYGTQFRDRPFFDNLSPEELAAWLPQQKMGYQSAEVIADLLMEEAEIRLNAGDTVALPQLLKKIRVMIDYAVEQEKNLKIFSLKHGRQYERLEDLTPRNPCNNY